MANVIALLDLHHPGKLVLFLFLLDARIFDHITAQNTKRLLISSKQNINHQSALIPFPELYNLIHFQLQKKSINSRIIMALPKNVWASLGHPELKNQKLRRSKIVNLKMFFFPPKNQVAMNFFEVVWGAGHHGGTGGRFPQHPEEGWCCWMMVAWPLLPVANGPSRPLTCWIITPTGSSCRYFFFPFFYSFWRWKEKGKYMLG